MAKEKRYFPDKDYDRFTKRKRNHPPGVSRFRTDRYPEVQAQVRGEKQEAKNKKGPENKNTVIRRARRAAAALETYEKEVMKPISEWDFDELERGRPRGPNGGFSGRPPKLMSRAAHQQMMDRYKALVREEMAKKTPSVLNVLNHILNNEDTDEDGKPLVPPSTKLDAAKFLIEHLIGKPKQETKQDISVTLQGMLAHAMVQPPSDGQGPRRFVRSKGALSSAAVDEVEDAEIIDEEDEE